MVQCVICKLRVVSYSSKPQFKWSHIFHLTHPSRGASSAFRVCTDIVAYLFGVYHVLNVNISEQIGPSNHQKICKVQQMSFLRTK